MRNITKRQHFVPQFYLKQFVDEKGKLHCYRKDDGKRFPAHPNDICFKEYGYEVKNPIGKQKFLLPNEIEKMFCTLEKEYSYVLHLIIAKCLENPNGSTLVCSLREKEILASMVANFMARNFLAVDNFVDEKITEDLLHNNQEVIEVDNLLREMQLGDAKPIIELAQKKIFLSPSEEGVTKSIKDALLKMNVSFFVTDTENFITSDCPVGYNCTEEEISMARIPLSPRVMVVYSSCEMSKMFQNTARLIDKKFIKKLNRDYLNWGVSKMLISKTQLDIDVLLE